MDPDLDKVAQKAASSTLSRGSLGHRLLFTVGVAGILLAAAQWSTTPDIASILVPTLASLAVFLLFSQILLARVGDHLFGEIGWLYLLLGLAYTLFPAFTFLVLDLDLASGWVWHHLSRLLPARSELGLHLWRHVLFLAAVGAGYLQFRGRRVPDFSGLRGTRDQDRKTVLVLFVILIVSLFFMSALSGPVTTYIESYTRYDHLEWVPRKFVSLCTRLKQGVFVALITFMFIDWKRYRVMAIGCVLMMAVFEVMFTIGSRIESLIVILMAICLYHLLVKQVTIRKGMLAFFFLGGLFSGLEILRAYEFDVSQTKNVVSAQGFQPASEFGAVYFTGFHLYSERAQDAIPPKPWQMFFNEFVTLIAPNDFTEWNPQFWYAKAYFPDAVVPPQTMGPIADSAIWGGELDLLIRGLVNGAFFAFILRWFISRQDKWWALAIYIFCYATCIMTLKYSVLYHLNPLFKTFLPTILLIEFLRRMRRCQGASPSSLASPGA